jgi:uncharacterized protein (TIGR04222 family)
MNPLDWTAGPFLFFYFGIVFLAGFAARLVRHRIGGSAYGHPILTAPELAYLAGGWKRVGDAVITGLLTSGAATLSSDGHTIGVDGTKLGMQPDLAPFAQPGLSGELKRRDFQQKIHPGVQYIRAKLAELGLCPDPSLLPAYRIKILTLFAAPLVLGIEKVVVGLERHKPVGILTVSLIVTAIVALELTRAPRLTRAGREALAAAQMQHSRAARAPQESEMMLAVALTGLIVLYGTSYNALYAASRSNDGGDGGGGGCSGGSGGDGGGGGGCGGCGG